MAASSTASAVFPAEWAPHAATWFTWPTNVDTWTNVMDPVRRRLAEAMKVIAEGEMVFVNVSSEEEAKEVHAYTDHHKNVITLDLPSNDSWCRDHGTTFLLKGTELRAVTWHYNAWGGKYPPFDLDEEMGSRMAAKLGIRAVQSPITLEGGALESNGEGILLTTASCVLNPNRNPTLSKSQAEEELIRQLGTPHIAWLEGDLEGDDTDGHIDNLARFVNASTVLLPRSLATKANLLALEDVGSRAGKVIQVDFLPEAASHSYQGDPLPCSHMNFLIANSCVILPSYGGPSDQEASEILASYFPDKTIYALDCKDVIRGLGAIHCLTQQVPMFEGFKGLSNEI